MIQLFGLLLSKISEICFLGDFILILFIFQTNCDQLITNISPCSLHYTEFNLKADRQKGPFVNICL